VLLVEEEAVLQNMMDRLIVVGIFSRMEMHMDNSNLHLSFDLHSSCIPEKISINEKGLNKK
jgi:hypothetical protein